MTPARAQLEGVVDALRRKQLLAVVFTALVELLLVSALVYALVRLGLPNLELSRSRRLTLAVGLLLVFLAALLLEQARQARSLLFLAKRIDSENQLDDHLVSALSFADPAVTPFERACVDSLIIRLQQQRLRIPEVRLERVWLLVPALLIAGVTGVVEYRRRARPQDDGSVKVTLPGDLRERIARIDKAVADTAGKVDPALAKRAQDTRDMINKMIERSSTKEDVLREISQARSALGQYESETPSLVEAALQLGDPSTQRANQLLGALKTGQGAAVNGALKTLIDALSGKEPPPLSQAERAEIASIFDALARATNQPPLAEKLNSAAQAVREKGTSAQATRAVTEAQAPLVEQLTREAAARQLLTSLKGAQAEAARQTELQARKSLPQPTQAAGGAAALDGGTALAAGANGSSEPEESSGEESSGTGGTAAQNPGAGSATDPNYTGGTPEKGATARDERVSAPWVGAPVKQIVAAGSAGNAGAQDAARAILTTQQRNMEREVRREEIPAEYAQAIRRYFFNLQRDWERQWKPSK